jgi:hypothetical protein
MSTKDGVPRTREPEEMRTEVPKREDERTQTEEDRGSEDLRTRRGRTDGLKTTGVNSKQSLKTRGTEEKDQKRGRR